MPHLYRITLGSIRHCHMAGRPKTVSSDYPGGSYLPPHQHYGRGEMYLTAHTYFMLLQQSASAGFAALKLCRTAFTVVKLVSTGPVSKARLKQGDKIISIGSTPCSRLVSLRESST